MKVYGFRPSGNCWKATQILQMCGRKFDWVDMDASSGLTRTPSFLAKNPYGRVPVVELDDGTCIAESNAILMHFAEGTAYLPPPGLARTRVMEWLFFEQYSHEPYIAVLRNVISYRKVREQYAARLPELKERGDWALGVMEHRLKAHPWLTDAGMTIADVSLCAYTQVADEGEFELSAYPHVQAWIGRVLSHPELSPLRDARGVSDSSGRAVHVHAGAA